ncbi:MAG TPA: hypothetical protein VI455_13140 [Terriglobia bacterium]
MKIHRLFVHGSLALLILAGGPLMAQQDQQPQPQQQPPQDQQQQPPQPQQPPQAPPSLRKPGEGAPGAPGEPPSLAGPHAANTNNPRQLLQVHAIFIEPIDNGLADKLMEEIGNKGPFRIVANRREADAVLRGTCFDSTRLKTVHSEVFLTGRSGDSIWQDVIRQPYKPPPLAQAVATTAQVVVEDLAVSIREAQGK